MHGRSGVSKPLKNVFERYYSVFSRIIALLDLERCDEMKCMYLGVVKFALVSHSATEGMCDLSAAPLEFPVTRPDISYIPAALSNCM